MSRSSRSIKLLLLVTAFVAAACSSTTTPTSTPSPTIAPLSIATSSGTLTGIVIGDTRQFLGVRYAQPPTGQRRWTLPQAVDSPGAHVDASRPGAPCEQSSPVPNLPPPSEDCLFLNVTTPRQNVPGTRLPVMVWWHGGGYTTGAGAAYEAQRLADTGNVMVVTVNYRLGIFGYLGLPNLQGSSNFGFADQLQSLRWVQSNAAAFGGDPDNVTVFGQSAGGMSTCAALTSPSARGLIDRAIISSGSCALVFPAGALYPGVPQQRPYASATDAATTGVDAAKALGCQGATTLSCLRALPVSRLLTQNENFSNTLAYGTPLLPHDPRQAVADGDTLGVPIISGGNRDENDAFTAGALAANPAAFTADSFPADLRTAYGDRADAVAAKYPPSRFSSAPAALARTFTDSGWACPTERSNRQYAKHAPVYGYEFSDETGPNVSGGSSTQIPKAAFHANDLPYVFDLNGRNLVPRDPQAALSRNMIEYWTSFARTGTPTASGAPNWPRTTAESAPVLGFTATGVRTVDHAADHQCDFWSDVDLH